MFGANKRIKPARFTCSTRKPLGAFLAVYSHVRGLMQRAIVFAAAVLLCACVSQQRAVVATATEAQCERPGVRIDAVKKFGASHSLALKDSVSAMEVVPGKYAISVACQNPFNETRGQCIFWGTLTNTQLTTCQ
jgi:hypothetical protein